MPAPGVAWHDMDHTLCVLRSGDLGKIAETFTFSFTEIASVLAPLPAQEGKGAKPLVVGASYSVPRRANDELIGRSILALDIDDGMTFEQVVDALQRQGIQAYVHTTASHTKDAPRLRAFIPLSRPVNVAFWNKRIKPWLRAFGCVDENAIDASRISFNPIQTPDYQAVFIEGEALDVDSLKENAKEKIREEGIQASAESDRAKRIAALALSVFPDMGKRHGFYLGLSGFLAKQLLPQAEAQAVIAECCVKSGAIDKLEERLLLVATTYEKVAHGEDVGGRQKLEEAIGPVGKIVVDQIAAICFGKHLPRICEDEEGQEEKQKDDVTNLVSHAKPVTLNLADLTFKLNTTEEWDHVLRYNEFSQAITAVNAPIFLDAESCGQLSDTDIDRIRAWFLSQGAKVSDNDLRAAISMVAKNKKNSFNPVLDFLNGCPVRKGAIVELADALHLETDIEKTMLRKWLISACARAYHPGCQADCALVLIGEQGYRKSSFLQMMFGERLTVSFNVDFDDVKRVGETLSGHWCAEIEEGRALKRSDINAMKSALSKREDTYRPSYARFSQTVARASVFAVTTNQREFLTDETGNRRFWCVYIPCEIDLAGVEAVRRDAWGEARDAYMAGEKHWLDKNDAHEADRVSKQYEDKDPIEGWLRNKLTGVKQVDNALLQSLYRDIKISADYLLDADFGKAKYRLQKALRRIGCVTARPGKNDRSTVYLVPDELANAAPMVRLVK